LTVKNIPRGDLVGLSRTLKAWLESLKDGVNVSTDFDRDDIYGTTDQIIRTLTAGGSITLSTPQNIDTDADVEFDSIVLGDLTALRLIGTDGTKKIISIADLTSWITGTTNQIIVTDDGDGSITLSLSSGIDTGSIATKTANYTTLITDSTILIAGTSNTVTVNLLTAVGNEGKKYNLKCIDDTFACDVDGAGTETIDGELTMDLILHETITIQSDNVGWWVI